LIAPERNALYNLHMPTINPYINFNGNAEEAFTFYRSVFGGEFGKITRFKDIAGPHSHVGEHEAEKILRITLPIGNTMLIANDVPEAMGRVNEQENRSKIAVTAESRDEAERIVNGLSAGGEVEMPLGESPWGSFFAMFRDKYGIEWTVECASKATSSRPSNNRSAPDR
jgi:PhnB protein